MAITISGENNNDKILASDGVIDQISGINIVGVLTATTFKGNLTGNVTGNLTGNVNSTSPLLLQTGGSERIRLTSNNEIGIAGANYGSSGQVLTSGGSGSAVSWTTIPTQVTITSNADNRIITGGSGTNLVGETELTYTGGLLKVAATYPSFYLDDTNTTNNRFRIIHNNELTQIDADPNNVYAGSFMSFNIDGGEKLRILSGGQVNIGANYAESANLFGLDTNYEGYPSDSAQPEAIFLIRGRGSNNRFVGIGASNTGSWIQASGPGYSGPTSDFAINPAGGKVSIGTNITDGLLHVGSTSAGSVSADADANELVLESSGNTGLSILSPGSGESSIYFGNPGTNGQKDAWIKYYHETHSTTADRRALAFRASGTERFRITGSGEAIFQKNVIVGGDYPWTVTGGNYNNLSISGNDASSSGFLNLGNGAAATNADFDLARIKFHNGASEVARISATTATSDSGDGHLRFYTKKAGSGLKEILRIRNDGFLETVYTENQQSYAHNISPTPCIRARNNRPGNGIYAGIQLFNQRSSGAAAVADIGVVNDASTDYVSYLTFTTRNSDTSYSEKIRIDSGGQIRYQYANNAKHAFALRETVRTITGHSSTGYQYVRCALLNSRTAYRCAVSTQGGNYGPGVQFFTVLRSWDNTTFYVTDKLNIGSSYANAVRMQSDNGGGTFYLEVNINLTTTSQGFSLSVTPLAANSGDMTTALQFYGSGMSNLAHTSSAQSL